METVIKILAYISLTIQCLVYLISPLLLLYVLYKGVINPFIALFRKSGQQDNITTRNP